MAIPWDPSNPTRPAVTDNAEVADADERDTGVGVIVAILLGLPISILLWLAIGLAVGRLVARLMGGG